MTESNNPLPRYNPRDTEDCEACAQLPYTCPYHEGVGAGIELMSTALRQVADDPDQLFARVRA